VGLDLGAETAEEIAVAIGAELIAARRRGGGDLEVGRPLRAVRPVGSKTWSASDQPA
jgi:xanthine/CO dehydrogenase XdhC/CoxF family maturation factor